MIEVITLTNFDIRRVNREATKLGIIICILQVEFALSSDIHGQLKVCFGYFW